MEHGASECVKELAHTEMTIKIEVKEVVSSTACVDIKIDMERIKEEPGLLELVKNEPVLLVKEEILEDSKQDEQQGRAATSTCAIMGKTSVVAEQAQLLHAREDLEDTEFVIVPTVPQNMDLHNGANQMDLIKQENTILNLNSEEVVSRIDDCQVVRRQVTGETMESNWKDDAVPVQSDPITSVEGIVQSEINSCDMCKKTFKTKASFKSHLKCIHGKSQFICSECNKQFKCQKYLTHHIAFVHIPQHKCEICDKTFKCPKLLANHIKFVHGNKIIDSSGLFVCDYCLEKFHCERELMSHLQIMHASKSCRCKACKTSLRRQRFRLKHNDNLYGSEENNLQNHKCDKCLKVYKSKESLWHHSKRVHGTGSHKCTQCEKEFKCESYLLKHVQYTHSEAQYECNICKKVCTSKATLSRHVECFHRPKVSDGNEQQSIQGTSIQADAGSVNEACITSLDDELDVKHEPSDLDIGPTVLQHMDIHYVINQLTSTGTGSEGNTVVEDCSKRMLCNRVKQETVDDKLSGSSSKQGHGSGVRKNQLYGCDKCLKVFKYERYLNQHNSQVHGTELHKCTQCSKEFKCDRYLLRHIRYTHNKERYCHICKKMYKSWTALSNHISNFHRNRFADPEDGNYRCHKCMKTFQSKNVLMGHLRYMHGTERYKCAECNKEFKCRRYLRSHITNAHGKQQYECDICKKICKSKRTLAAHISRGCSRKFPEPPTGVGHGRITPVEGGLEENPD